MDSKHLPTHGLSAGKIGGECIEDESLPCNRGFDRTRVTIGHYDQYVSLCIAIHDSSLAACTRNLLSILQFSCSNIDAAFPATGEERTAKSRISTPRSEGDYRVIGSRASRLFSLIAFLFFRAAFRNQLAADKSLYPTRFSDYFLNLSRLNTIALLHNQGTSLRLKRRRN